VSALFRKLNLKDQTEIAVLQAPKSFDAALAELTAVTVLRKLARSTKIAFGIGFAITQKELESVSSALISAAAGDAVIWIAYPKQTSKKYKCEFNRDSGWKAFGDAGFETVRMVAIDDDWSALRFRRCEYVKSMTRAPEHAVSATGKQKARKARLARGLAGSCRRSLKQRASSAHLLRLNQVRQPV
jgi:hypothetical protein